MSDIYSPLYVTRCFYNRRKISLLVMAGACLGDSLITSYLPHAK